MSSFTCCILVWCDFNTAAIFAQVCLVKDIFISMALKNGGGVNTLLNLPLGSDW